MVLLAFAIAPLYLAAPNASAKRVNCELATMMEGGLSREEAAAGRVPKRIVHQCRTLRRACRTFVSAQNDPVLEARVEKHTRALVMFRESGHEQSDQRGEVIAAAGGPDAAIGALCKKSFPKAEKIQEHDFGTWVPLMPDPDGTPPQLD